MSAAAEAIFRRLPQVARGMIRAPFGTSAGRSFTVEATPKPRVTKQIQKLEIKIVPNNQELVPIAKKVTTPRATHALLAIIGFATVSVLGQKKEAEEVKQERVGFAQILDWQKQTKKPVVTIAGLNGLGRDLSAALLDGKDYNVLALSRKPEIDQVREGFLNASTPEDIYDVDAWKEILEPNFIYGESDTILVVNMIGGDRGDPEINKAALAMASALDQLAEDYEKKVKFVNVSSIAPEYVEDHPYCKVRQEVDFALISEYPHITSICLRPGVVIPAEMDADHPYSPQQLAKLPIQPVINTHRNILTQPVFASDMYDAILNCISVSESKIINAVGPDCLSQEDMVVFYRQLAGKKVRILKVPNGKLLAWLAENAPLGRLDSYAIAALRGLDSKDEDVILPTEDFRDLVGHKLRGLDTLTQEQITKSPPIREHIMKIFDILRKDPAKREDFFAALKEDFPEIAKTLIDTIKVEILV